MRFICEDFGLLNSELDEKNNSRYPSYYLGLLNRFLLASYQKGENCALIIDEAQNLSPKVLESIRLLSNLETSQDKLLQILLIGQPELSTRQNLPRLRQLKQRVMLPYHLRPLSFAECSEYIINRMERAGGSASVFTPKALEAIYAHSGGIPRLINILCDNGMLRAYASNRKMVDAIMIREVTEGLGVFEVLRRAGDEKKEFSDKPRNRDEAVGERTSVEEVLSAASPDSNHQQSVTIPPSEILNGKKTWRERVQELLFGWDLGRYKSYRIVALEKDSAAAEQYKILREKVKGLRSETGARSFSVTSPVKHDGKTMVAVNLAAAMALEYEEQVLLIDGDLRSPNIHRYFDIKPNPGLTDYLSSNSHENLMDLVQGSFLGGLRILPAGTPTDLSSELLARLKMRNLMDEIRSKFPGHLIIVDSPPLLSTPDPLVLAREVDGVIMVIRAGKTPREYLVKAIQSLNSNKLMGIVLNGVGTGMTSKYSKKGS